MDWLPYSDSFHLPNKFTKKFPLYFLYSNCTKPHTFKILEKHHIITSENIFNCKLQYLWDEVKVGHKSRLKNDGHVGGVKQLDGVRALLATCILWPHGQNNTEPLEVDDNQEDQDSCKQVGYIWKILPVKCLTEGSNFVSSGNQEVEQGNDSTLKLGTTASIDSGWAECFPDDVLTANQEDKMF